jgi:hypothetical protein
MEEREMRHREDVERVAEESERRYNAELRRMEMEPEDPCISLGYLVVEKKFPLRLPI